MLQKQENMDHLIRNIKEGEPRGIEQSPEQRARLETAEQAERATATERQEEENRTKQVQTSITPENAHQLGLKLLAQPQCKLLLKELIAQRLIAHEAISLIDTEALVHGEEYERQYGLTHEHIAALKTDKFLCFDVVQDGDDVALTFTRVTGESAIRSIDNIVLCGLLQNMVRALPQIQADVLSGLMKR